MVGTFTATPMDDAQPPYMQLTYDSGSSAIQTVSGTILRDGVPVRVPEAVTALGRVTTWKDYDAPYDVQATYLFTLQTRQAPTGSSPEDWTGTLSSKGWTSISNVTQGAATLRTNLFTNPGFEVNVTQSVNGAYSDAVITRSTAEHYLGAASLQATGSPDTITNLVTDPLFSGSGTAGWTLGSGSSSISMSSGHLIANGSNASGRVYANSPEIAVSAGTRYYFGANVTRWNALGVAGDTGFLYRWYNSAHTQIDTDHDVTASIADGATRGFSTNTVAPSGAAYLRLYAYTTKALNTAFNQWFGNIYVDNFYVNNGNAGFFSGGSADTSTLQYDWTGTPNASTSTRKVAVTAAGVSLSQSVFGGNTYTFSFYAKRSTGSSTLSIQPTWTASGTPGSGPVVTGALTTTWKRFSYTSLVPTGVTSVSLNVFTNLGFGDSFFMDAVLVEQVESVLPYFDGTNNEFPTSTLGTWSGAWVGTSGLSTSTASYNHTISPTSGSLASLQKAYTYAVSAIQFQGFRAASSQSETVTITFSNGSTLVLGIVGNGTQITFTLTSGTTFATMVRQSGGFTGQMDINFVNGAAFLVHVASGTTISVPVTSTPVVSQMRFQMNPGVILPFALIPGVVTTTETGTATATLSPDGAWLIHPYTPEASLEIDAGQGCQDIFATAESARELTRTTPTSLLSPVGSKRMIAISLGSRKDPSWQMELSTKTAAAYDAVVALFDDGSPLRFDYPASLDDADGLCYRGMRVPKGWFAPGDLTEERDGDNWRSPGRRWGVDLDPVSAPTAYPGA